jgi:tetratricopeptide (TPR) repeat protein
MSQSMVSKAGAKPARERLRLDMLARGCSLGQIADEMVRSWGFRPRQAWRYANSLPQEEVARQYNEIVGTPSRRVSSKRISDYEAWPDRGLRPTPAVLSVLAAIYHTSAQRLVDMRDIEMMPPEDVNLLAILDPRPTPPLSLGKGLPESQKPAEFHHNIRNVDVMAAAHESSEHAASAESTNIGPATLEQLRDEVSRLAHALMHDDPVSVFSQVIRVRDRAYRILDGHQYPSQTSELYLLVGVCCCLLADASHLLGYRSAALEQTRAAWAYAEVIGHNSLRVWCRSMQSWLSYTEERPQQAVALAQSGLRYADNPTSRLRLKLMEGTAYATMGDSREALGAFAEADAERERPSHFDELFDGIGGSFAAPPAKQHHNEAAGYIHLGLAEMAERSAKRSIDLYTEGPDQERDETIVAGARITLATAQILRRDIDAAQETLDPVLNLPAYLRADSLITKLRELRAALQRTEFRGSAAVLALQAATEDFGRSILPAALPGGSAR